MNKINLQEIVGGQLQAKFERSFEKVIENLQDPNTSFKVKRGITIKLDFTQNEDRDDVSVSVMISEKLASQQDMNTKFYIGKDLKTEEVFAEEYGKQVRGQMNFNDVLEKEQKAQEQIIDGKTVDTETGEIKESNNDDKIYDFRKAVRNERRLELAFENQRWFDLLRWGIATQTVNNYLNSELLYTEYSYTVNDIEDWQTFLPIPVSVIDINPEIAQNTGY